jgi:formylglycine-generating enzyme required for sulfatase activity/serine/threonine protein kinase
MGDWDFHCPNCFSEKTDGKQQCQFCGYDEGESRSQAALPLRTILNSQYVVGRVLGNPGGFGITYLCWDTMLRTRLAIKEFMPRDNAVRDGDQCNVVAHIGKDREFFEYGLKAFLAEVRTVAGFDHPNIVRVKTYFEQNHTAYLVMDYYEGVSLAEYVKQKGGRLPEKAALGIMGFILDGLRHVHEKGYLHRDVKPTNIYLTGKGQVILLDFGAARYAMGEHSRSLSVVVTPGFSPLEQYSTNGKQGPWTDIYASGATLYYMLTGRQPESAPDRVLSDTLAEPVQLLPDLSPSVNKGLMLTLRINASDRPQSIEELKKILGESPQPDPEVNIKKTDDKSGRKKKLEESKKPTIPVWRLWRRKKVIAIGVCLLVFLVLLIIVYGNWGQQGVLVVMPHPEDAEVWVDGVNYGQGRLRLEKVKPGKRVVSAKRSGYAGNEKSVEIMAGQLSDVEIHLALLQGILVVMPHPEDAEIWVDGVNHGQGRLRLEKVEPGKRVVSAKRSGYAGNEKTVEIVAGQLSDVEIHLALLQGALKIATVPSGAEVSVNGIGKGKSPVEVSGLSPGAVKVRVSSEGYVTREESVDVVGGEKRLLWDLRKAMGILWVVTEPSGAEVSVNGIGKGKSPVEVSGLSPGTVKVRLSSEGYVTREESVDVVGGEKRQMKWSLQKAVGVLRVLTVPSGAEVSVNGVVKGKSPVEVKDIKPGQARVRVSMNTSEYAVRQEVVNIEVGQEMVLEWSLQQVKKNVEIEAVRETPVKQNMAPASPKIPGVWKDPLTEMEFVWVPGGCHQMGCGSWDGDCQSDEKPIHEVCVGGFWIGQTEVTQGQWQRVLGNNPSNFKKGDNYPVEQVSWEDAEEYIRKLNVMGSAKFRLPSEAEWEYAARSGGKAEKYSGGSDLDSVAWYNNGGSSTHPVKTKKSNGLGVYDMTGNVWEWCEDVYSAYIYGPSDKRNPIYYSGLRLVFRGGSWYSGPNGVRCARRNSGTPAYRSSDVGFRLLRIR